MSLYRVLGKQAYNGYQQDEQFIGQLTPEAEERAIARGAIEVVHHGDVVLDVTRAELPRGWVTESQNASE